MKMWFIWTLIDDARKFRQLAQFCADLVRNKDLTDKDIVGRIKHHPYVVPFWRKY